MAVAETEGARRIVADVEDTTVAAATEADDITVAVVAAPEDTTVTAVAAPEAEGARGMDGMDDLVGWTVTPSGEGSGCSGCNRVCGGGGGGGGGCTCCRLGETVAGSIALFMNNHEQQKREDGQTER